MSIADITITSIETITAFDVVTGNYKFTLDELQSANIAQTQESSDVTGKGGRKLSTLKRNKAVNITASNGLVSGGLMETQTGCSFVSGTTTVLWADYLTVKSSAAQTTWKAIGTTGAEIESLYIQNPNGTLGEKLAQAETAAENKFTYNPESKALAFHTSVTEGTKIVAYYKRKITGDVLTNESDKYSGKCTLFIDALAEDKCANVLHIQIFIPKADFSGEFSLDMGGDQVVHGFDATALAGACGTSGELWKYTVFGENTEDVV